MKFLSHKVYIVLFLIISSHIFTQQINPNFLNTIPDNIREDIQFQLNQDTEGEDIASNSNLNTRVQYLEAALEEAEFNLERIRYEVDSSKNIVNSDLSRFGEEFFKTFQSTFQPLNQPVLASDHIIGVGDKIKVNFLGSKKGSYSLLVSNDGSINIPEIGKKYIVGKTLESAEMQINIESKEIFLGSKVSLSIEKMSDISALIIGNVKSPGIYTLNAGSPIISLIHAAGGISTNGSFRSILHKRNNAVIQEIDLYDILINGNLNFEYKLRSGDVLIVNPIGKQVRVSGGFAKPAIYEFKNGERIIDILLYAGIKSIHSSNFLSVIRVQDSKLSEISLSSSDLGNFELNDGDSIKLDYFIPDLPTLGEVVISGEVRIPGTYTINENTTLLDLIIQAGGYTQHAYPNGASLIRESVIKKETELKDKAYDDLIKYLVGTSSFNNTGLLDLLSLLKRSKPSGRVVTEFDTSILMDDPSKDIYLSNGDVINIPKLRKQVYVYGEVMNSSSLVFEEGKNVFEYIKDSGGFTKFSDSKRVIIISPNGSTNAVSTRFKILSNVSDIPILPGTTIYVPREIGKVEGLDLAARIGPVISSLALSLASLNSIIE